LESHSRHAITSVSGSNASYELGKNTRETNQSGCGVLRERERERERERKSGFMALREREVIGFNGFEREREK
jgi:hypothetical protein